MTRAAGGTRRRLLHLLLGQLQRVGSCIPLLHLQSEIRGPGVRLRFRARHGRLERLVVHRRRPVELSAPRPENVLVAVVVVDAGGVDDSAARRPRHPAGRVDGVVRVLLGARSLV